MPELTPHDSHSYSEKMWEVINAHLASDGIDLEPDENFIGLYIDHENNKFYVCLPDGYYRLEVENGELEVSGMNAVGAIEASTMVADFDWEMAVREQQHAQVIAEIIAWEYN